MSDRTVTYRLRAELGSFAASMAQASASTKKLAGDMTALTKEGEKSRRGLESVGKVGGAMGLVAAAGLGAAVLKAADFDQSMSKVQAATHETAANMEDLRQAALDAGADTAFSATEAAAGIENLAKAGVSTEEILSGGLMGALDLAAAGELDVAEAAEAAAGAMAQFKLDGADVPHIADLLAAGAGKAQGEVSDMVMALKQAGTVSSQTGLTLEETTGALAAMAEQSLLGSDAGTSFKQMLASLTPNSEKAATAMEEMGFSAFDAQGQFVGMEELAGRMRESFSNMTDEQRLARMETIFGSDAVRAASIIYDNGAEGIQEWIDKTNDAGYAAETAAIKQDNLRGDLEKLGGALETALIGTGEGAQGPLRSLVQGAEDLVNAFNDLPSAAKKVTGGLLGITAVLGGGVWFGSKVIQGITKTQGALENLGVSSEKSSRAMKGVAKAGAAVAAIGLAAAAIRAVQAATDESLPGLEAMTGRLLDLGGGETADLGSEFDSLGESIRRVADKSTAESLTDTLQTPFAGLFGEAGSLRQARAEISLLDSSLADLVNTAGPDAAADALTNLAEAQGLSASELTRLETQLPEYDEAIAGAANETKLAALDTDALTGATKELTKKQQRQIEESKEQAKALKKSRDAARETADAFFGIGDKVDKAKVSLGEWLRDLEKQAEALRNFRINAQEAAKRGLDEGLIKSLEEAGPAGALRMKQLANATDDEIDRANRAWRRGQREIKLYTDAVGGVKPPKPVRVDVETDTAMRKLKQLKREIRSFFDIDLDIFGSGSSLTGLEAVPGFHFASGGWTGAGGKYEPKGVVHGDEYVFSKEATHGNVAMLERLHRQLRGYAQGGLVQRHATVPVMPSGGGSVDIDYQRLAQSLATVRPLYGDVHLSGDDSFRRELRADQRRASLGGV